MRFSQIYLLASLLALGPHVFAAAARKDATRSAELSDQTAFKGAIVLDVATGQTLFEDRANYIGPPASVTKLMTFLLVHDRLGRGDLTLQTPINVTAEAAKTGGSQVYLAEKEIFPLEDMLYALMIASANDVATALAIHLAGSKTAFIATMNSRAQQLGMTDTTFRSPHGLPPASRANADSDQTSPRDLAKLSLHLLRTTNVLTYTSVKLRTFRPGPKKIDMVNHNHLLGKVAGVDGLKTGFTRGAGFCLAATAIRHGRRVLVITMGSPDSKTRDIKIAELIERGFAALPATITPLPSAAEPPIKPAPRPTPAPADDTAIIKFSIPKK